MIPSWLAPTCAIIGGQWGDEGKGKIIDFLASQFDVVVRATGGNNAGHTVFIKDQKHVFHLLPSSMLMPKKVNIIADGVVIDPVVLLEEIENIRTHGFPVESLFISINAHVVFPFHRILDAAQESQQNIGTTGRGIGPCYTDRVARRGISVMMLLDKHALGIALMNMLPEKIALLRHSGYDEETIRRSFSTFTPENALTKSILDKIRAALDTGPLLETLIWTLTEVYHELGMRLLPFITNTTIFINELYGRGKRILFEGAQGTFLDVCHGTYPYVTSSHPTVGGIIAGTGFNHLYQTLLVFKAYTTRVGAGPFVTELTGLMGETLRNAGNEYGATTGRPRRCGWYDAVMARHAALINGSTIAILTKLDVLSSLERIFVCIGYKYTGPVVVADKKYEPGMELLTMPPSSLLHHCTPILREFPGWQCPISHVKTYQELPADAKAYIKKLEELSGLTFKIISVGKERDETIIRS